MRHVNRTEDRPHNEGILSHLSLKINTFLLEYIVSFSVIVAPMVFRQLSAGDVNPFFLVFMGLKEVLIGAMMGLVANFPFYLAECIGNLIDRLRLGYVTDLFNLLFIRFYVFNVADAMIVVGMILLGITLIREERHG